jgi:hypothetical protein
MLTNQRLSVQTPDLGRAKFHLGLKSRACHRQGLGRDEARPYRPNLSLPNPSVLAAAFRSTPRV